MTPILAKTTGYVCLIIRVPSIQRLHAPVILSLLVRHAKSQVRPNAASPWFISNARTTQSLTVMLSQHVWKRLPSDLFRYVFEAIFVGILLKKFFLNVAYKSFVTCALTENFCTHPCLSQSRIKQWANWAVAPDPAL